MIEATTTEPSGLRPRRGAPSADGLRVPSAAWHRRASCVLLLAAGLVSAGAGRVGAEGAAAMAGRAADSLAWSTPNPVPAGAGVAGDSIAAPRDTVVRPIDYLWVLRNTLVQKSDIDRMVERAQAMGVKGLLVQVVGRGDAYFHSALLPPAEALRTPGFDALGALVPAAHAAGLEVHAWMNCCLVWSGAHRPRDPRHVVNAHPEWIARMQDGRSMARLGPRERERLQVEGVFLNPAHPGVRTWIARIAQEIARDYAVDGIHLDYIRQPSVGIGADPTTRARFALEQGVDPSRIAGLPRSERAGMESAWQTFQLEQVTSIVREVRDSLRAVRPGVVLSAAVLADTVSAVKRNKQAWADWLRTGLLDRAFAMCYAPMVQTVMDQLTGLARDVGAEGRLVPGIAIYNTPPATTAAKILGARTLGYPAIALYSYDSLWERPELWPSLRGYLAPHDDTSSLEAHSR